MLIEQLPHKEACAGERITVPVAGGVLVYEHCSIGKDLSGFVEVENWDALSDGLAARGHNRGAVYRLPELDR